MDREQELERFQEKWATFWGCLGHKTLGQLEEHGLYVIQFEGFPGKSRRADWEEQQEAWELITRGQTSRG